MRIYIAAPFAEAKYSNMLAVLLRGLERITITSSWHSIDHPPNPHELYLLEACRMDLADIRRADVMLLINKEEWENKGTGGRHFETGYAIAHQIPVLIYGKRSHALQYHELIYTVPEGSSVRHILDQLWWMNAKIKPRRKSTRISRHRREDARDSCEEKP